MLRGGGIYQIVTPQTIYKSTAAVPPTPLQKIPLFLTQPPFLFHTTKILLHKHIVFYHHFLMTLYFPKFIYKVQTFPHQYDDLVRTTVYIIYIIYLLISSMTFVCTKKSYSSCFMLLFI